MFLDLSHEANNYIGGSTYEVLPEGKYVASVTMAEVKTTKAGTGKYIKLEWTIDGPSGNGRKVWSNYLIENPNHKAVEIGREQLGEIIVNATPKMKPEIKSVQDFVGKQLGIHVTKKSSKGYGEQNEVKYCFPAKDVKTEPTLAQAMDKAVEDVNKIPF